MLLMLRGAITLWSWIVWPREQHQSLHVFQQPSLCHCEGLSPAAGLLPWLALITGGLASASLAATAAPKSG